MNPFPQRTTTLVMLLAAFTSWGLRPADAQILKEFGNEVHGSPAASPSGSPPPASPPTSSVAATKRGPLHTEYDDDDSTEDVLGELALIAGAAAVSAPFLVPRAILKDEGQSAVYPDYPYDHDGTIAAVCYDETIPGTHHSLIVLQAAYGSNLDDINQFQGRIFGDLDLRLGFDTETSYFTENVPTGTDEFWRGDANLTWRFAQNERWQFRAGIGVNWVNDRRGTEAGINGTYNIEWFPKDPWVLSSSLDAGSVGSSGLLHTRNTVGLTHNGWGVFTGHDYLKLDSTSLQTWISGIEYRF
ncbi:MAG: hypothetical protein ABJZ55_25885 [Fuerstiella sp.]